MRSVATLFVGLALAAAMAGCRVHVDKDTNGEDKNVQVDTPFGGVHVNADQTTAADLGLPVYPGAELVRGDDKHKSADVHVGFGDWQLRVKAVTYQTPDSPEQVTAFYKKALGRYGDVVTCQGNSPVGLPTTTHEGLTCNDDSHSKVQLNEGGYVYGYDSSKNGLQLKAGSKRHQHVVGFDSPSGGRTRFALVALDLPAETSSNSGKSD
jgi:hypothetical protein